MPVIVGIDLSLGQTGIAINLGPRKNDHDMVALTHFIKSKPAKADDRYVAKLARFNLIHRGIWDFLEQIIQPWDGTVHIFLEGPAYQSKGSSGHDIAGNWWIFFDSLQGEGATVKVVPPSNVKQYATGKGNASKDTVMASAIRRYLDIDIPNNDVADAVVLMALGSRYLGVPIEDDMPKLNLKALDKL